MKFGIPVWVGDKTIENGFAKAHMCEADYIEISMDYPWPEKLNSKKVVKLAEEYGISVSVHAAWRGLSTGHTSPVVADANLEINKTGINFAYSINANYYVVHFNRGNRADFTPESTKEVIKSGTIRLKKAYKYAKAKNVPFLLENNESGLFSDFKLMKKAKIPLAIDIGHAIKFGYTIDDLMKINKIQKNLQLIHLHDCLINESEINDHYVLGNGNLDLEKLASVIKAANPKFLLFESVWIEKNKPYSLNEFKESITNFKQLL